MKATDLQNRPAYLAPGETLLLPMAEVEEAFHAFLTSEERRDAAVGLAVLYRCSHTACEMDESHILITCYDDR